MNEHDEPELEKEMIDYERYMDSLRDDEIESAYKKEKDGK